MSRPDDWFNQVCAALGLFDGARPVSTSEVLREEVLPAIQALKENNPEAAILIEENVRLQRLWRDALAMAVANKRKEGRMTERIERGQWMAWRGIETAPTNTSVPRMCIWEHPTHAQPRGTAMTTLLRYLPELCAILAITATLWTGTVIWDMLWTYWTHHK